ncbi:MAG: phosphatidylserine decarboxylase [Alphaproteobacteria bacterium]|nr:phosphatidylserine decarboxylase [Alphaproteobacteria bacterium]
MKLYSLAVNKAGWPFIGIFALITVGFALICWPLFVVGALATLWCVYFFRDPDRVTPVRPGVIVSPADGKVIAIEEVIPEADLGLGAGPRTRISVFLNIFDVHINRSPASGTVIATRYRAGKFLHAASDKASVDNERMAVVMELGGQHPYSGQIFGFVQIAGLVARRIVCCVKQGDKLIAGERYGLIRFGSRADIYLPTGLKATVLVGQYMIGGETVLADCFDKGEAK